MRYYDEYYNRTKRSSKKLRRSEDGILFGVCSGLAEWLGLSTALVRGVYLVLLIATGFFPFGLAYIAGALFIPLEETHDNFFDY